MSDFRLHVVPFTPRHWSVSDDEHYSYGTWPKKKVAIEQGNCLAAEIGCELLIHNSKGKITKRSFPNHSQPSMPKRKKTQKPSPTCKYLDTRDRVIPDGRPLDAISHRVCHCDPKEPNPRSRPDKTDSELFAEWEEYRSQVERPEMHYWVSDHVTALKDNIAAIAKELGPKLMEMRVAKTEERLRKLENKEAGGNGPSGVTNGKLMLADTGNVTFSVGEDKPLLPWWKNLMLTLAIGGSFIALVKIIGDYLLTYSK